MSDPASGDQTAIRLQLLARGYHIIPNIDRRCVLKGWADTDYPARELSDSGKGTAAERVARWESRFPNFRSTGVRIENGLGMIDLDIDDRPMIAALSIEIERICPGLWEKAPMRIRDGSEKIALMVRVEGARWTREGSIKYDGHAIEIFGGAPARSGRCSRQFGIYGPHSYHDDGSVKATYAWDERSPQPTGIDPGDLPAITHNQADAIVKAFVRLAQAWGWKPEVKAGAIPLNASAVYTIDRDTTRFDTLRGSGLTYAELCDEVDIYDGTRCSANFLPGRGESGSRTRCGVSDKNRHGVPGVYLWGDEQIHFPVDLDPGRLERELAERLKAMAVEPSENRDPPAPPADDAELFTKAQWLVETRAYFENEDSIVRIYDATLDCRVTPSAFARRYRAWQAPNPDRRFKRPVYATDLWEATPARLNLAGVRMRPDAAFPLYAEGGQTFKNTYRRPRHPAEGGAIEPFLTFMERFLPDPRERAWLLDWMAHKQRHPEVPGTAVIFVADNTEEVRTGRFGTGRGLLFSVAHQLYGPQYAISQSFNVIDGSSSQSVFNDWIHGSVLVTVDESRTSSTAWRRGERNAVYEVLKDIVDPAPKKMAFKGKYRAAFSGMSYCSFWIATNHADAVAIPANDRRFTVLRNGRTLTPAEADAFVAWRDDPANIGALSRWLADRDLTTFRMFSPLDTATKADMAEYAITSVEELFLAWMDDDMLGLVFTRQDLMRWVAHNFKESPMRWQGEFEAAWPRYSVKVVSGGTGSHHRIRVGGTQRKVFCFPNRAATAKKLPDAAIKREIDKWLHPSTVETQRRSLTLIPGLTEKDE